MRVNFNVTAALASPDGSTGRAGRRIGRILGIYGVVALAGTAVAALTRFP